MRQKLTQRKLLYILGAVFIWLPYTGSAQSVKRQCISSYASVVTSDNLTISQTAGQSYNTVGNTESKTTVLQGFQQPTTFLVEDITSSKMKDLSISVYPNPATYSLSITSEEEIEQAFVQVVDINGKNILSEKVDNLQQHSINCEAWVNGVYLIKIKDADQNTKTLRLIISK